MEEKNTHTIITTRWKPQDPFFAASWPAYLCRWGEVPNQLAELLLRCDYHVREMSCHPQNSELACSTPRSHFLLSLVRLFHCSSPSRPSLDWSVKIWLKQTRDVMRCYEKKPLQATNDVLFKTRIFPLCQCLKILIWFFCSLADAALYNLDSSKRKHQKPWKMAKQHQSWVAKYWTTFEWFSNDAKEKQHFEI